jgi:L-asparaginase II
MNNLCIPLDELPKVDPVSGRSPGCRWQLDMHLAGHVGVVDQCRDTTLDKAKSHQRCATAHSGHLQVIKHLDTPPRGYGAADECYYTTLDRTNQ